MKAGENTFYRHQDGKLGYLGQSSQPLFVGLGDESKVDAITVRWPSGVEQVVTEVAINTRVTVTEPKPQ